MAGILLVLLATLSFAASDAMTKRMAEHLPALEIAWLRYGLYSLIMLPWALRRFPEGLRTQDRGLQVLRGAAVLGASVLFILALEVLPIAEATAISFVSPAFITLLSILVLTERVGPHRWFALVVGLLGVLVVMRPGSAAFQPGALLPVASAACWAIAMVTTRRMSGRDSATRTMTYTAVTGFALVSLTLPLGVMPTGAEFGLALAAGLLSTLGQWSAVLAYRRAEASLLAPFSYAQIVTSSIFGILLFAAVPDAATILGATIIVASGLYSAHRERIRARQPA